MATEHTLTAYGVAARDGHVYVANATDYMVAHRKLTSTSYNVTANTITVGQYCSTTPPEYYTINRGKLVFDTSSLPDNCRILSAKICIYGETDLSGVDFYLVLVRGKHLGWGELDPTGLLSIGTDYGRLLQSFSTRGSLWTGNFVLGWNTIELNDIALTEINREGNTVFGLRSQREIDRVVPAYYNLGGAGTHSHDERIQFYSGNKDAGGTYPNRYKPYIEIVYETAPGQAEEPVTPEDPGVRVSGLIHRFSPGNYTLEIMLGGVTTDWIPPPMKMKPQPTVEPKEEPRPVTPPVPEFEWGYPAVKPPEKEKEKPTWPFPWLHMP